MNTMSIFSIVSSEGRLARHRFLGRIEIADEQVDPFDAVFLHRRGVATGHRARPASRREPSDEGS